jgi:hypothetical protein
MVQNPLLLGHTEGRRPRTEWFWAGRAVAQLRVQNRQIAQHRAWALLDRHPERPSAPDAGSESETDGSALDISPSRRTHRQSE